jgi:intein/homing endonuclease
MGENFSFSNMLNSQDSIVLKAFDNLQNLSVGYPELIYDGPFSDGLDNREVKGITGAEISEQQAKEKFIKIFKYRKEHITDTVAKCNGKEFKCCKWSLKNTHLHTTLNNLGCVPNKSLILKFPTKEIFKNEDLIYDFIRGYVDGDGCLWLNQKGKLTIEIMGTKEFLEGILEYFPNKMTLGHKDKRRPDSNTYRLIGCASNALNICSKLYDNASVYLERKYSKYKTAVSNSNI